MIKEARATGLYAELDVADMIEGLQRKPDASANLIVAADAMVYLADLSALLTESRRVLEPGGTLAFTLETHDGRGVILGEGLRYAHGAEYVREVVTEAGLKLLSCEAASPRNENNEPVRGLVVVAEKT
jgi:predicted TPR repeat methyltransferase